LGHVASECHIHSENIRHRLSEPVELAAAQAGPEEDEEVQDDASPPSVSAQLGDLSTSASSASEPAQLAAGSSKARELAATVPHQAHVSVALSAVAAPRWVRVAVASALGASLILLLAGTFLVSFDFEISGIFIEFLFGHEVSRQYSLLIVGMAVTQGRSFSAGLMGLEVVFLLLAVVVPLVLLTLLLILWLTPMKLHSQEALLRVCYVMDGWSSLDVAVLVLVIANLEFGKLAEFLVYRGELAAPCHMIRDLTRSECVQMGLTSRPTMAFLLTAGFAMLVLPKVTMRLCAQAIFKEVRPGLPATGKEGGKKVEEEATADDGEEAARRHAPSSRPTAEQGQSLEVEV